MLCLSCYLQLELIHSVHVDKCHVVIELSQEEVHFVQSILEYLFCFVLIETALVANHLHHQHELCLL